MAMTLVKRCNAALVLLCGSLRARR